MKHVRSAVLGGGHRRGQSSGRRAARPALRHRPSLHRRSVHDRGQRSHRARAAGPGGAAADRRSAVVPRRRWWSCQQGATRRPHRLLSSWERSPPPTRRRRDSRWNRSAPAVSMDTPSTRSSTCATTTTSVSCTPASSISSGRYPTRSMAGLTLEGAGRRAVVRWRRGDRCRRHRSSLPEGRRRCQNVAHRWHRRRHRGACAAEDSQAVGGEGNRSSRSVSPSQCCCAGGDQAADLCNGPRGCEARARRAHRRSNPNAVASTTTSIPIRSTSQALTSACRDQAPAAVARSRRSLTACAEPERVAVQRAAGDEHVGAGGCRSSDRGRADARRRPRGRPSSARPAPRSSRRPRRSSAPSWRCTR